MEQKEKAIAHFEGLIRDTDQVLPHCSEALRAELLEQRGYYELALEALRAELLEQRGYYELALEALRPAPSDEPLTREQLMQVRPERPILVLAHCLDEETGEPDPEDEEFLIWDGQCFANAGTYDTLEHYGKKFLAYAYAPAWIGPEPTETLQTLGSAQGPKGEPGPFGAETPIELLEYLIASLEHDIAADVCIRTEDGVNRKLAVDAYVIRQVLEVLRPALSDEPLTREQLMQVREDRPILVRTRFLDEETGEPDPEDEEFMIWDGFYFTSLDTCDTLEHYGKVFLAYAYAPAWIGPQLTGTQEALLRIAREPRKFEKPE